MIYMYKAAYSFLLLPGIIILLLGVITYWVRRYSRSCALALMGVTFVFYLLSTDYIGDILIHSLEKRHTPPSQLNGDVIVMLGGGTTLDTPNIDGPGHPYGSSANRLLTAALLHNKLKIPIIVSSGQLYSDLGNEAHVDKRILLGLGIPEDQIILEDQSLTTKENVEYVKTILETHNFKQPILVTAAFHMERSVWLFSKQNITVQTVPTDYYASIKRDLYFNKCIPTPGGIYNSGIAIREYFGLYTTKLYYALMSL